MVEPEVVKTQSELLAEMKVATDAGDWKAVSKISSQIAKTVAAEEKAEKDAKLEAVATQTAEVKKQIDAVISKFLDKADPELIKAMDGVWYVNDFGEQLTSCRLLKTAPRKAGTGGGGKKLNVTTTELLKQVGDNVIEGGELAGKTFQEAFDSDTGGNFRYKLRLKMAKVAGLL